MSKMITCSWNRHEQVERENEQDYGEQCTRNVYTQKERLYKL